MATENIHQGHRKRLKEKFEKFGLEAFEDHEVLEFLLTFAIPQKDVNPLAHKLISHFGSLNNTLLASPQELMTVPGVGEHAAVLLSLMPKMAKRFLDNYRNFEGVPMVHYHERMEYFRNKFLDVTHEVLLVVYLDNNYQVLGEERMAEGSVDHVEISIRKITEGCARFRATGVILAHNHLAHITPSPKDISATKTVRDTLNNIGINLVDHLIVCKGEVSSFSQEGRLYDRY